jgi:hypothetical protein
VGIEHVNNTFQAPTYHMTALNITYPGDNGFISGTFWKLTTRTQVTYPIILRGSSSALPQMQNGKTVLVTCSPDLTQPFASQQRDPSHGPMASKGGFPDLLEVLYLSTIEASKFLLFTSSPSAMAFVLL